MILADIYQKAAEVVRTNGHNKGHYYRIPEGAVGITRTPSEYPVCAAGALSIAIHDDPMPLNGDDAYDMVIADFAHRVLTPAEVDRDPIAAVANWNDDPARTPADVIAAFEQAAKEAA